MVFDNIFGFAQNSAGLFSVRGGTAGPPPDADVDFEDAEEGAYDDKSTSLFTDAIHGASSRAKVVQEQSPEARVILGFLGSFIRTTQASARTQSESPHAGSVSDAASDGMGKANEKVKQQGEEHGLRRSEKLQADPDRDAYSKPPKAPEAPKAAEPPRAPQATTETPQKLGETQTTTENPSGSQ
ncbi:hypothetical protein AB0K92_21070 [Streptomyces sp. NPDC052687]|uniref:hypothetical protein n=1 Tax=Streptomyces sp. NPDC052687 TaxID=3154759 RepID=UPI003412E014